MSDVAVIGGGIVGSSVAYHAARAGLSVTLIDRAGEGHATAAGAGIIASGVGHRNADAHHALAAQAGAYYPTLLDQLASVGERDTGYDRVGGVLIATNDDEATWLADAKRFADECLAAGVQGIDALALLDGAQARQLFPPLASLPAALFFEGTARVDGRLMRGALQRAARHLGASMLQGEARLGHDARDAVQVVVDSRPLPAGSVVIAAGAWSGSLAADLGVHVPVFPQRGQIAHLAMPETDTSRWPVVMTFQDHYLLTFSPDRVVAGATRESDSGFDYRLTTGGVHQVLDQALRIAPGLACGTLREVRIGFRPLTPDGLPILGRLPGLQNAYIATGHGPTGLTLGPHAGSLIVDLIRGAPIALDLAPYAAERFQ